MSAKLNVFFGKTSHSIIFKDRNRENADMAVHICIGAIKQQKRFVKFYTARMK